MQNSAAAPIRCLFFVNGFHVSFGPDSKVDVGAHVSFRQDSRVNVRAHVSFPSTSDFRCRGESCAAVQHILVWLARGETQRHF